MNSDEIFSVAIYPCTSGDSSNCVPKIKDLPIFPLYNIMTNHKNGTYSFSYERPSASKISVQVYLLNPGEVHQDFYEASNLGSSLEVSTIVNYLSFDDSKTMSYGSGNYDYSVLLNSCIMFPYNGPTQLKYACENSCSIYLNEHYYTYNLGVNSIINNEIYTTVSTNACYSLVTYVSKQTTNVNFNFNLSWKSPTECNYQQIPITSIYLPTPVDPPFNIKVKNSVCGDSLRTGTESCDDGSNTANDGCNANCNEKSNWGCFGGSPNSKDTCISCDNYISPKPDDNFCYDGNNKNGDGCSSHCHIELGWTCSGGSASSNDSCILKCGGLTNKQPNYCYDGNNDNGDGCDFSCNIESGWTCNENNADGTYSCTENCGDGKRFNDNCSYCDDGNTIIKDGCNNNCEVEKGWVCTGGDNSTSDVCKMDCEYWKIYYSNSDHCNDGNNNNGDGCDSECKIETGWNCTSGSNYTKDSCSEICGDGIKFNSNSTYCDDSNKVNGDGCNSSCTVETGWVCTGGNSTTKDTCIDACGDGKVVISKSNYCDDGNTKDNDGCSSNCSIETGWKCSGGNLTTKDTCIDICGDGKKYTTDLTFCDDGNTSNNDGCSSTCSIEAGWVCTGGNSTTKDTCEICGDGKKCITALTFCDDGNTSNNDGCSSNCSIESGWECSGGNLTTKDTCLEICGDGRRFNSNSAYCDDGNLISSDGCSSNCIVEKGWKCSCGSSVKADTCAEVCGDGIRFNENSTYCDDGNINDGDGCSSICTLESNWKCSGGNSDHKDECREAINQAISSTSQAVAGAAGGASALFSFCNLSTPTGLWITMNQFQLIMLLLLTKSNIPRSIVSYLAGLKATTCSFNFIPFKDIPGFDTLNNFMDFKLPKKELDYFGVFSGSTFANNFSLLCLMMIIIAIHSAFSLINKLLKSKVKTKKKCVKLMEKMYQFFVFNLYVRIFLEANIFLLLTSFSELYQCDLSSLSKVASFICALFGAWVCFTMLSFSLINWYKHRSTENLDNYIPLKEFLSGVKTGSKAKLYSTYLLSRRILFVFLLIFGESLNNIALVATMIVIQILYLSNMIIIKPLKQTKDNIIEITNECFYFVLVTLLAYFNTNERWAGIIENIYLCIILCNSMTIILIMLVSLIIMGIQKCKQKCSKNYIKPKINRTEENKTREPEIRDFSSYRISNAVPITVSSRLPESDISFAEESKHPSFPIPVRSPTKAEQYWMSYNPASISKN